MKSVMKHTHGQALPGQTLVLFALMSLMLLAGLGLIFDAGLDYSNRRTMQNAADTAAIRGARIISQQAGTGANTSLYDEVVETAMANGVPEAANVLCDFLNDNLEVVSVDGTFTWGTCHNFDIPAGVTGVRVRVSETHTPLVMRALGVTTSGTAATAAAQVQMVINMDGRDFPFMVCGVETAVVGDAPFDILTTELLVDENIVDVGNGPEPSPFYYKDVTDPWAISDYAYSYDWNDRNSDGSFRLLAADAPQFIVYGDGIENCGMIGWKGRAERDSTEFAFLYPTGADILPVKRVDGDIDTVDDASPYRSINGPQGCKADALPNGCIMLLPIGSTYPWCPTFGVCFYQTPEERDENSGSLLLRRWGVFYIEYDDTSGEYWGRMIKNYPMHTDGETGWDPDAYVGPLNITLVQTP